MSRRSPRVTRFPRLGGRASPPLVVKGGVAEGVGLGVGECVVDERSGDEAARHRARSDAEGKPATLERARSANLDGVGDAASGGETRDIDDVRT